MLARESASSLGLVITLDVTNREGRRIGIDFNYRAERVVDIRQTEASSSVRHTGIDPKDLVRVETAQQHVMIDDWFMGALEEGGPIDAMRGLFFGYVRGEFTRTGTPTGGGGGVGGGGAGSQSSSSGGAGVESKAIGHADSEAFRILSESRYRQRRGGSR